jgi:aminoglycoside phosphotransferase
LEHFSLLACHTNNGSDEDEALVHGDYCLPNVLFDADGCHYLDMGEAGVGIVTSITWLEFGA